MSQNLQSAESENGEPIKITSFFDGAKRGQMLQLHTRDSGNTNTIFADTEQVEQMVKTMQNWLDR